MELQALLAKSNALPSIPKVVSEVLSELDADDPSPRKIGQLVATDPALTARMLKLANSAFFNVTRQISSVDDAVGILGFSHVRTLVTAVALSSSFKAVPGQSGAVLALQPQHGQGLPGAGARVAVARWRVLHCWPGARGG